MIYIFQVVKTEMNTEDKQALLQEVPAPGDTFVFKDMKMNSYFFE